MEINVDLNLHMKPSDILCPAVCLENESAGSPMKAMGEAVTQFE
jgi:hypothetical protein